MVRGILLWVYIGLRHGIDFNSYSSISAVLLNTGPLSSSGLVPGQFDMRVAIVTTE